MSRCGKCGGWLYGTRLFDRMSLETAPAMKCANCGDVIDSVILEHRAGHVPKESKARLQGDVIISKIDDSELRGMSARELYDKYGFSRSTVSKERTKRSGPVPESATGLIGRGLV